MLPSPRLIILVMAAAPLFLAGALFEGAAAVGVLYVLVLILYTGLDALLLPRRRQIGMTRNTPERVSVGYPTAISYTVENHTRRRLRIQLAEDCPEAIEIAPAPPETGMRRDHAEAEVHLMGGALKRSLGVACCPQPTIAKPWRA